MRILGYCGHEGMRSRVNTTVTVSDYSTNIYQLDNGAIHANVVISIKPSTLDPEALPGNIAKVCQEADFSSMAICQLCVRWVGNRAFGWSCKASLRAFTVWTAGPPVGLRGLTGASMARSSI